MTQKAEKKPHILSLMLLSAFAAMGALLMTPGLPDISKYFSVSTGSAQFIVSSFLLGYSLGQLLYGPIANRFGRKPALYAGIAIATLGSIFSILSSPIESFSLLIFGRFLEALGASAGLVISFTIINDFYTAEQARKMTALLTIGFAIVPGAAVAIGGILTQLINWQSCFYFLLAYGLTLLIPCQRLPETILNRDHTALHYKYLTKNYWKILLNRKLIGYALCSGFSSAIIYVFGSEGPFIGMNTLGFSPSIYGMLGLTPFIGTFLGSLLVVYLSKTPPLQVLKFGFFLELIASLTMFLLFFFQIVSIWSLLIPMGIICIGHPILSGTALSLSMNQTHDKANGSAIMNFVGLAMPVIMTFLLGALQIKAAFVMPTIFLISLLLMFIIYLLFLRKDEP